MRAVLYTHDMEPITAIHLTGDLFRYLEERDCVTLPVLEAPTTMPDLSDRRVTAICRPVTLTREWFWRPAQKEWVAMLFTQNEEDALLLRSTLLPGQQRGMRDIEDKAFARGVEWLFAQVLRGGQ